MRNSKIEWTDDTWSPVAGCERVSAGCAHCYAVPLTHRFQSKTKWQGLTVVRENGKLDWSGVVRCSEEELLRPLSWKKPKRIFVNSTSDTFHKDVPDTFLDKMFAVMALCPQHTFQVLTKRPERAAEYFRWESHFLVRQGAIQNQVDFLLAKRGELSAPSERHGYKRLCLQVWPLPNVWIGTSVENQATADDHIPHLVRIPAYHLFLSCEPLLGSIDLSEWLTYECPNCEGHGGGRSPNWQDDGAWDCSDCGGTGRLPEEYPAISWVIVGGESGPNARPVHPNWIRSLRDQCVTADVPFFFKQWGCWAPAEEGDRRAAYIHNCGTSNCKIPMTEDNFADFALMRKRPKNTTGRILDGRTWNQFPEVANR